MKIIAVLYKQEVNLPVSVFEKKEWGRGRNSRSHRLYNMGGKRKHLEQPPKLRRYELGARLKQRFNKLYKEQAAIPGK